jgi:hypothetical protein
VRLLLGGVAARLDLAYEKMDDLQLAVESILRSCADGGEAITLRAGIEDGRLELWVGPLDASSAAERLSDTSDPFGLVRVLATLVEDAKLVEQENGSWIRLEQPIAPKTG